MRTALHLRRPNATDNEATMVESAVLLIAADGNRKEDMNVLREDTARAQMLGYSSAALDRRADPVASGEGREKRQVVRTPRGACIRANERECMRVESERYAAQPDEATRAAYLRSHGCSL